MKSKKIVSLIGVRRSGKTSTLQHTISQLRETVDPKQIVYLNFEDDRLDSLTIAELDLILEAYYELYPLHRESRTYWFFDEIQNIEGWEKFIRRMHDTEKGQIFITGSSAKLLGSELATSLRGRTLRYEVFPFSFREYLRYQNVEVNLNSSANRTLIKHHFDHYLTHGGFAECFDQSDDIQRRILRDYLDLVVYRDIVDRFGVTNRALLKHLIKYLFVNPATLVSYNKLYNEFRSQGFRISKDTLIDYFSYLNDAYAAFSIPIFRKSVREEQRNPKKIYIIDNGYKRLYDAFAGQDTGKLYENLVFLHLRRQTPDIYYFKQAYEVDFFVEGDLINVSAKIDKAATRQREIRSLEAAMHHLGCKESLLLTAETEETIKTEAGTIRVLPVWEWLCSL
ncbi:ATP-binding protein [Desulfosarcina ovata]|uniref:ATP-binding protein n=1 Tax=Desulfosarcina ovata TaxID=83564 RepID=UPI0018D7FBDB|nr:ATP-binding protein [Desulfosarcina ovata]